MGAERVTAVAHVEPTELRFGPWSPEEDAILRANYEILGPTKTAAILGRNYFPVCVRAKKLGLSIRPSWTRAEERRLAMMWGELTPEKISATLGRTQKAIMERARRLKLPSGPQRGTERISGQARRTGFHRQTLRGILAWAGVEPVPAMSCHTGERQLVEAFDSLDVDEAVEKWLATEVVNQAAERRGMRWRELVAALERSGLKLPPRPKRAGDWWRVPTAVIDEAIASLATARGEQRCQ